MTTDLAWLVRKLFVLLVAMVVSWASLAQAATPEAWAAFRQDVEAKCRAAAETYITDIVADVDQTGSESYGFANLQGASKKTQKTTQFLCVYDKRKRTIDLVQMFQNQKPAVVQIEQCGNAWAARGAKPSQEFGKFMRDCFSGKQLPSPVANSGALTAPLLSANEIPLADRRACWNSDEPDNAIAVCTKLITSTKSKQELANWYEGRSFAWAKKGNFQKSVDDLTAGIQANPQRKLLFILRGERYEQMGLLEAAYADFLSVSDTAFEGSARAGQGVRRSADKLTAEQRERAVAAAAKARQVLQEIPSAAPPTAAGVAPAIPSTPAVSRPQSLIHSSSGLLNGQIQCFDFGAIEYSAYADPGEVELLFGDNQKTFAALEEIRKSNVPQCRGKSSAYWCETGSQYIKLFKRGNSAPVVEASWDGPQGCGQVNRPGFVGGHLV